MSSLPVSVSALAFVTTIHFAMASLRNHRRPAGARVNSLATVSVLLGATPWLFPTPAGLGLGLLAHLTWFLACEKLAPPTGGVQKAGGSARSSAPPPAPRPAAPSRTTARPARPKGFVETPVITVLDEGGDIRTIRLRRPDGFDFVAGQFITVRARADGRDHARCYSISSPPEASGYLEISVKRQGVVSNMLHATARPGSSLTIKAPAGAFTYPADDDRPLVLVAGGVGITPLMSMARHAMLAEPTRPVTLLYSARTWDGLAFRDELQIAARRHTRFKVFFAVTGGTDRPDAYPGRIDARLLETAAPELANAIVLMCGPQAMIDGLRATLPGLGVASAQIRFEVFQAAVAASAGAAASPPGRVNGTAHRMKCARSGHEITVEPPQTLLDAAEAAGVEIPSLCRAGVCGTCRTKVIDGDVHCASDVLDDEDRREGYVLACVATPLGDCTVDA